MTNIEKWHTVFKTEKQMFDNIGINDVIKEREDMTNKVLKDLE